MEHRHTNRKAWNIDTRTKLWNTCIQVSIEAWNRDVSMKEHVGIQ
jgi:hypothetical protein